MSDGRIDPDHGDGADSGDQGRPIRVGDTVRRPARANSGFVQGVLLHLERAGVVWSPRALGLDEQGRETLTWISGTAAASGGDVDLGELAIMVRELHDRTAGFAGDSECVIHDDLQPRNVIVERTHPVGLIDWEQARPGRRVEDVANLCWAFVEPMPGSDPADIARQWRFIVDAYSLDRAGELVPTVLARMAVCVDDIERNAAAGSARHRRLADLGHHDDIRAMHAWTMDHRRLLDEVITSG